MSTTSDKFGANAAQAEYWNVQAGPTWVAMQEQLDRQIAPLGRAALQALAPTAGEAILDIGCGCGQTSVDLAERVGAAGRVVGVDLSAPMLEVARCRPLAAGARRPEFRQVDAQVGDLGSAIFDAAYSRFGVMFFSDPVAAFSNIRRALTPTARLAFVCWRPLTDNVWMTVPFEAARPFLPPATPADPLAPGPFALADADRLRAILRGAGFASLSIDPFTTAVGSGDLEAALSLAVKVGPLGAALRENPQMKDRVSDAVRIAMRRFVTPAGVFMPASVWVVTARGGGAPAGG
jgi:SAM-dependent methyltransferase